MNKVEFILRCHEHTIDPNIALQNENVCQGLYDRDREKVIKAIKEEF
tara:strand:+ start:376 stop:516 length:141 start_codon:yes stop_codon:yes gene_type:complete